jgi:hemoglobin/transferrin/lactoferrin receptor protein
MGNQVLVLVDGIRRTIRRIDMGLTSISALVDTGAIDRIEVVRGPDSVLYGSDAIGGRIGIETRRPLFTSSGRAARIDGRAMAVTGSPSSAGPHGCHAGHADVRTAGGRCRT